MKYSSILIIGTVAMLCSCQSTDEEQASEVAQIESAHLGQEPAFAQADYDANGQLSATEVATYYHREALADYDLDGDSHISRSEWASAHPSAAETDEHFNKFDKDGNGEVTEGEAVAFVTEHVSFGDSFSKYDANGDFSLHWQEVDAAAPTELSVTMFSFHPRNS
ncbi:EF-hand domain-containing protein [Verrucomicrobiales bacterium BCK34]|nr:EF-hand domain-containing protein [Verrucomicrobiales bacterium BCK34]